MPEAITRELSVVAPRRKISASVALEEILKDRRSLESLRAVALHYTALFANIRSILRRVRNRPNWSYLIDFDVIHQWVEVDSTRKENQISPYNILFRMKAPYYIPAGAFCEFMEYLAHFANVESRIWTAVQDLPPERALVEVAKAVGLRLAEPAGGRQELLEAVLANLDGQIVKLGRLASIFGSPNFQGLKATYPRSMYEAWHEAITNAKRPLRRKALPRDLVDSRDAMNLAIASTSIPTFDGLIGKVKNKEKVLLLVSQTGAIVNLLQDTRVCRSLSLLSLQLNLDLRTIAENFPVVHAANVRTLELLEGRDNPELAATRAEIYEQYFRALELRCEELLDYEDAGRPEARRMFAYEWKRELRQILENVLALIQDDHEALREIEAARSAETARAEARSSVDGKPTSLKQVLFQRVEEIKRKLAEIQVFLEKHAKVVYSEAREAEASETPLARFDISIVPGHPVVILEVYYFQLKAYTPEGIKYFKLRWPVLGSHSAVHRALSKTRLIFGAPRTGGIEPHLRQVYPGDSEWEDGFIVHTSFGAYGMSRQQFLACGNYDLFNLRTLGKIIRRDIPARVNPFRETLRPMIEKLVLVRAGSRISYDALPLDGETKRYITFISNSSLTEVIYPLISETSEQYVFPNIIQSWLQSHLCGLHRSADVGN